MLHIQKGQEPLFLTDFKKKYPSKTYESTEFGEHKASLNAILRAEQKGLCAYCCGRIEKGKSHNEHIEPQNPGIYTSNRSLDYTNIVASCNCLNTCGNKKGNNYDASQFVSPLDANCEDQFIYYADGRMDGNTYTIDLLNLNAYELKQARRAVIKSLQGLDKKMISMCYMDENAEEHLPYYNVIKWYWNTL